MRNPKDWFKPVFQSYQRLSTKITSGKAWQSGRKWMQRQPRWRLATYAILLTGFVAVASVCLMFLLVRGGAFGDLPTYADLANIQNDQASEVIDQRGNILGKYYIENRVNADSSELPSDLVNALIATEDSRFFDHRGVDIRSLGRVLVKSILLSDESSGGGSTISQQLAKNLYPRQDYAFLSIVVNKFREMIIAHRLEKVYSKEHILRLYLNTVPFGGNAFGVKIAAQRFFNKDLEDLSTDQAAVLVGMLKATTYYNPRLHPDRAMQRRNVVLNQMVKGQYLDSTEADELMQKPIELDYQPESHNVGLATYFREHVRQELAPLLEDLEKPDGSSYNLYTDGLRIFTTVDAVLQKYAESAVREHLSYLQEEFLTEWNGQEPWHEGDLLGEFVSKSRRYQTLKSKGASQKEMEEIFATPVLMTIFDWDSGEKEVEMSPLDSVRYYLNLLQTGMLAANPETGAILAWVGGVDHRFIQYDHVKSKRQIGSTMKPLVYTSAIRAGIEPCEYMENQLVQYADYEGWEPRNSDGAYGGYYSMEGALSHSVNTVAVDLAMRTGISDIGNLARQMGIDGYIPNEPAIALGAVEASLWEMVQVYATFANHGRKPELHWLDRVETRDGEVLLRGKRKEGVKQVLTEEESALITHFMQSVVDSGTARRLRYQYDLWGDIAGKTGTTQNQSDGWFMGYSPRLVAGVWVGAESPKVHFRTTHTGQGARSAMPIWGTFMQKVRKDKRTSDLLGGRFPMLADTVILEIDCPHYLPELPELFDSIMDFDQLLMFSRTVENIESDQLAEIMEDEPRKERETLSEYSQRIRERNLKVLEKRERRKKRKAFFDKLFNRDDP